MARQRNRRDPVSPMKDSVSVRPRPVHAPSCFQSTTSFGAGSGGREHAPNRMADAAANTRTLDTVGIVRAGLPTVDCRLWTVDCRGRSSGEYPQELVAFGIDRSYVWPFLTVNPGFAFRRGGLAWKTR